MSDSLPTVPEQRPIKAKREKLITASQAKAAAQECGMSVVKVERLAAESRLGQYIEQLGATRIGRSTIMLATEHAKEAVEKCDRFIAQQDGDMPLVIELHKLKASFLDVILRGAAAQIKAEKKEAVEGHASAPLTIPFPPGTQVAFKVPETTK